MSKYKARKVECDGRVFDSTKEKNRYLELKAMQDKGEICDLECQPRFVLIPKFEKNGKKYRETAYVADFAYRTVVDDNIHVEDVKSGYTAKLPVFVLKHKLFEYRYPHIELEIFL